MDACKICPIRNSKIIRNYWKHDLFNIQKAMSYDYMGGLKRIMRNFKFEKESDNRWYIVLPEWKGDKEELEMVCGADTMLDIVAQGEDHVYLTISDKEFDNPRFILTFNRGESEGGWYDLKSDLHEFEVWLCHVTKFVFNGELPKILYCA